MSGSSQTTKGLSQRTKHTKDIIVEQVTQAGSIGKEAVISGTYLYPVAGAYYLISHPHLWKPLQKPLLLSLVASVVVTASLFLFTYLPQAAFMCLFNGPLGFTTAIPLVLGESGTIVLFLARIFWLTPALNETFDSVLLSQGHTKLVENGREIEGGGSGKRLGKVLTTPLNRFTKEGIIRYIISLPLNAIPIVGTVFFLFYNGKKSGPSHHTRYFQLKQMNEKQKAEFIQSRQGSYTAFGTAAMALNLIPGASVPLAFGTAVGAALWASDVEKKSGALVDVSASSEASQDLSGTGKKVEL